AVDLFQCSRSFVPYFDCHRSPCDLSDFPYTAITTTILFWKMNTPIYPFQPKRGKRRMIQSTQRPRISIGPQKICSRTTQFHCMPGPSSLICLNEEGTTKKLAGRTDMRLSLAAITKTWLTDSTSEALYLEI
ncbi:unnamed protein product, partial [Cylicocyclus nassatus]